MYGKLETTLVVCCGIRSLGRGIDGDSTGMYCVHSHNRKHETYLADIREVVYFHWAKDPSLDMNYMSYMVVPLVRSH